MAFNKINVKMTKLGLKGEPLAEKTMSQLWPDLILRI